MRFLNFTPQEIKALLFLLIALLVGSGITIYKKHHPSFAPELIFKEDPSDSFEERGKLGEEPKDTGSYLQDTSHEISKISGSLPAVAKQSPSSKVTGLRTSSSSQWTPPPSAGFSTRNDSRLLSPISNPQKGKQTLSIPKSAVKEKIDLNSASASELELLPQIGPVLSQRIINYRNTKGKFQKIEDVMKVSGIGLKTFEKIKDFITVK
jgi:competence protein ComEA